MKNQRLVSLAQKTINPDKLIISMKDQETLRRLAGQVAQLVARPIENEKRDLWFRHNTLEATRPLIFCSPENGWNEIIAELGVNQTLGASNISFGMPDRNLLTSYFLAIAIAAGVTCPIVDVARVRPAILATDLALGCDDYAWRYIRGYRQHQKP